ncbi:MAG: DNA/RNA nuclease SfsA [Proteobacteria bacterium]|nr:DNA/RNA nuclease SfsA [Pseudomonadota bacterium]
MRFSAPLVGGRLLRRYKRFLSDVRLADGAEVTAHCANPGSMTGLAEPGSEVWLSRATNPARKLAYSWELVRAEGALVGINTARPNAIVEEAIRAGAIRELRGYGGLRREVRYGTNSRIDLLLEERGRAPCYVEVKNVHLKRGAFAEFPDAPTARGAKHLTELRRMAAAGARALTLFLIQRGDCARFKVASDIDPVYDAAMRRALAAGVEAICYSCRVTLAGIEVDGPVPLALAAD